MFLRNKKADQSISIVLLVFMVMTLVTSALFILSINSNKMNKQIVDGKMLNEIYSEKMDLDFNFQVAVDKAAKEVKGVSESEIKREFFDALKVELKKYNFGEYSYMEANLQLVQIGYVSGEVSVSFYNIDIEKEFSGMKISYVYDETFFSKI